MAGATAEGVLVAVLCLVAGVAGRSTTVPAEACQSMMPSHGHNAQLSQPPYNLIVRGNTQAINSPVNVVLAGAGPRDMFRGFFVKAFDDATGRAIGSFTNAPKTIDCGGVATGAHHAGPSAKNSVTLTWQPPVGFTGSVSFMATVVQTMDTFWVGVVSKSVNFS
ncbi:putative defense protein [Homarus americanus]|nr:putative defense protein [Homarus americanus]